MSTAFIKKSAILKMAAGLVGIATALVMMGGAYVAPAKAQSVEDLTAQIQSLLATITALQAQLAVIQGGGTTTGGGVSYTFAKDLKQGDSNVDVLNLQKVLNQDPATQVASSGVGSAGNETQYFGSLTKAAVIKFQDKYAASILTPVGLTQGTGYVGPSTRAKLNSMSTPTTGGGTTQPPVTTTPGTGLTVSSGSQPAATLATKNAARIPFTRVTFTAGFDGDVTVNGVTIERSGLAQDAVFSGITLLDENGLQLGIEKTLNSNHQATVGDAFVVKAGQSRTMTIAGNMATDLTNYAGQIAGLNVVGVNTSATVTGSLPITGAGHTINNSLTIGTFETPVAGASDPGASNSKDIGTTGYTFSSVRFTAGSAEDVRVKSIRWNQSGSAAASDIANVRVYVDGVAYDTIVSSDGKYYTAAFGNGIVVAKGTSKEISIKGDIVDGSGRTIDFDIYRRTDIDVVGETYGYGITPANGTDTSGTDDGAFHQSTNPWYDAYQATVSGGSLTIENATTVGSQNISVNAPNQVLGGLNVEAKGEPVSVASMVFNIEAIGDQVANITSITLVGPNGAVVAGPVDGSGAGPGGTVTFTDTVTFPVGKGTYTLKGKLGTSFATNDTVRASTTPSSQWTSITGQTTGNSITAAPASALTMSQMTVKAAAVTVSVLSTPLTQTTVAGGPFTFANYQFDASQSGDDIRFNTIKLDYEVVTGTPTNLTSCGLYDGSTALQSGSNLVDPTASTDSSSFTLDSGFTVPKQSVKTLALKCNTSATTTTDQYRWGINSSTAQSATAVQSGVALTESSGITVNTSTGQTITMTTGGSYTVVDDSTPGYTIVSPGAESTLLRIKFSATQESVNIKKVAFELKNTASNTPLDLVGNQITLWDGSTQIGTATFVNNGDNATSTAIVDGTFLVPQGGSKTMTVKGTIANISSSVGPLTASGDLVIVAYDGDANGLSNGNYGTGAAGGTNITPSSSDVTPSGVRVMKSIPTFTKITSGLSTLLQTSSDYALYRFSVKADNGDVEIYKLSFSVGSSTVSATTSQYALYAYTDSSFSNPDTTFSSDGLLNANKYYNGLGANSTVGRTSLDVYMDKASATTTYKVPSGATRYFELRANVATVETGTGNESIAVSLLGDAAYPSLSGLMSTAGTIDSDTNNDFIWSPVSTTTATLISDFDFTNGYLVPGLPTTNMSSVTHTSTN